jgi:hypothetical protein
VAHNFRGGCGGEADDAADAVANDKPAPAGVELQSGFGPSHERFKANALFAQMPKSCSYAGGELRCVACGYACGCVACISRGPGARAAAAMST